MNKVVAKVVASNVVVFSDKENTFYAVQEIANNSTKGVVHHGWM